MIYYLGFYDKELNNRIMSPAAVNKMNYIAKAINANGEPVTIVSCGIVGREASKEHDEMLCEGVKVHYFDTMGKSTGFAKKIFLRIKRFTSIFFFLCRNVKRNEPVIVYHSLHIMRSIKAAKRLCGFRLILEAEELYNDVKAYGGGYSRDREMRFLKMADAYVFPTQMLDEKINLDHKPSAIVHGTYEVEPDRHCKFNDGKIHVVYAGTFDPHKGGATTAAATAEFLDERYHVHIIGFGSDAEKKLLLETVEQVAQKTKCTLTYDGLKSGEEYIRFLQSCDIGLSAQNPNAEFNATSFPSKVLSYLANGLRVVTVQIPALEISSVNSLLYYYDRDNPQNIANTVLSVDMGEPYDSRSLISRLDRECAAGLKNLLYPIG